jgi:NAD(P)-dependent dehydrogenase (short-subunit alcohol dehydrogenase family)
VDKDLAAAKRSADHIFGEGGEALALEADVCNTETVEKTVALALEHFGKIDVLHNNVGIAPAGGPLDIDDALFQKTMDINVGSILRTTRAVLPHFLKQGSGVITNISSLASIRWSGYSYFAYYASKAALNQATVATALEFADKGVRANAILPGVIDTPLVYQQIAAQYDSIEHIKEQRANAVPMKRTGTPWDIANAAVFLASDAAGFITGVCLPVDGGHSCAMPGMR